MPFLTTLGTLQYGTYTFDASSKVTVSSEMVQDEAQRTIVYQRQTFTVSATVAVAAGTDDTLEDIKAILGEQGSGFRFLNRGFGNDVKVNVAGGVRDLKFGPAPKILEWEPIGNSLACEIVWQVVICVPHCTGTTRDKGILAFNYEVDFNIDRGNTTRTISGYLEIAQTRQGRRAPDCADLYRRLLKPGLPDGFERKHNFHISQDKSRLDFQVNDSQLNSKFPFPANVVSASGRHRAAWSTANRGRTTLRNSISMELEMVPGVSQAQAWGIFGQIVKKRIAIAKGQGKIILIDELIAEEDIWGRTSAFSCNYRILQTCGACLTKTSGLWQPIDTDWRRWKLSMSSIFNERGHAELGLPPGDAIIDLCGAAAPLDVGGESKTPKEPVPSLPAGAVFKNTTPPPANSYTHYEQTVAPYRERPVQRQAVLQAPESPAEFAGADPTSRTPFNFGKSGGVSDFMQIGGRARHIVQLIGIGIRAGFPVPRPALEKVGDRTATEMSFEMPQTIIANWLGVPIFKAYWRGVYALDNGPGQVKQAANPKENVDPNGKAICDC